MLIQVYIVYEQRTVKYLIQVFNLQLLPVCSFAKLMTSLVRPKVQLGSYLEQNNKPVQSFHKSYEASRMSLKSKLLKAKQAIKQQLRQTPDSILQCSQSTPNLLYRDKQTLLCRNLSQNLDQQNQRSLMRQSLDFIQIGNSYYYSLHHIQYQLYKMIQSLELDVKEISYFVGIKSLQQIFQIAQAIIKGTKDKPTNSKSRSSLQKQNLSPQGSYYFKTIRLQQQISEISKKYQEKKAENIRLAFQNRQLIGKLAIHQLKINQQNTKIRDLLQLVKYDYQKSQAQKMDHNLNQKSFKTIKNSSQQELFAGKYKKNSCQNLGNQFDDHISQQLGHSKALVKHKDDQNQQKGSKRVKINPRNKLINDQGKSQLRKSLYSQNDCKKQVYVRQREKSNFKKQMNNFNYQNQAQKQGSEQLGVKQLTRKVLTLQKENIVLRLQIESYIQYMERLNGEYNDQVEKWAQKQQFYQRQLAKLKSPSGSA